jgi:hypothetical protein
MGQHFLIKGTYCSSDRENAAPQWAFILNSVPAAAGAWHLKDHMLKVDDVGGISCKTLKRKSCNDKKAVLLHKLAGRIFPYVDNSLMSSYLDDTALRICLQVLM